MKKIKKRLGLFLSDSLDHPVLLAADILATVNIICMIQILMVV